MIRVLALCLLLAAPASAQGLPDPNELVDQALQLAGQDDMDGAYQVLAAGVEQARRETGLSPDWGLVFAILADTVRNHRENPGYALRLTEEGLAIVRPAADQVPDIVNILSVSQSYALADLGRMDEAVAVAEAAEPALRAGLGDKVADDYLTEVAAWKAGRITETTGVSPMKLSERSRTEAEAALDDGDYARVLTLASQAVLPQDTGLPDGEVARNNADALRLAGRALFGLDRKSEALDALLQGSAWVMDTGWTDGGEPEWLIPRDGPDAMLADLFIWLAKTSMEYGPEDAGYRDLARQAIRVARSVVPPGDTAFTVGYLAMTLDMLEDRPDNAEAGLRQIAAEARAAGAEDFALLSEFYIQTVRAFRAETLEDLDSAALVAAAEAGLAEAAANPGSVIDPLFLHSETAAYLVLDQQSDLALAHARAALALRQQRMDAAGGDGLGGDAFRRNTRTLAETLMEAALQVDSRRPGARCAAEAGIGCGIIVETSANPKD